MVYEKKKKLKQQRECLASHFTGPAQNFWATLGYLSKSNFLHNAT